MKLVHSLVVLSLSAAALPAAAADEEDRAFSHMLALVHTFVRIAAHSDTRQESLRAMDEVLAGRNSEANRAAIGLFDEVTAGMSERNRDKLAAIGRDLASIGRKDARRAAAAPESVSPAGALQARKDLHAMGLRYYDEKEFLAAVERNDALAVELFIAGRGVNLAGRDAEGRSALDIARASGNAQLADLLARNLPAAR